jgi:hypothetical protein
MITMLGAIAEFERGLLLERQREGVAKAKADGKYKGRKPTARAKAAEVIKLESDICIRFRILTDTCPCESGGCAGAIRPRLHQLPFAGFDAANIQVEHPGGRRRSLFVADF